MPTAPDTKAQTADEKKKALNLKLRETLGEAYAVVMGAQYRETIASVTLEQLMQQHIEDIEGEDGKTAIRPNKKDQVEKIKTQTLSAIETAKNTDPSEFKLETKEQNANTPE